MHYETAIINLLNLLHRKMDKMALDFTALINEVASEKTVIDSAITLINGFADQLAAVNQKLADAIAAADPALIAQAQASLDEVTTSIHAEKEALAAIPMGTKAV